MAWSRCVRFRFRLLTVLGIIAACAGMIWSLRVARAANAFTPGNVVIYRVGDGSGSLVNTGNPVFLDEYTPTGTLVQSIALPTATAGANHRLIASGTAKTNGTLPLTVQEQLNKDLDAKFPNARSKDVVEFEGKRYQLRFSPAVKSRSGKVKEWDRTWVLLECSE